MAASDASSWSRQSQRRDPMASPVRHSECRRTGTSCFPGDVAVHERGVLLSVAVVPERDHLELAEAGGQLGNGGNADADLVLAHTAAVMETVLVQELLDLQMRQWHSDKIHPTGCQDARPGRRHLAHGRRRGDRPRQCRAAAG